MLGSRDMAFPRLNALSYWVFLFAGLFLYASFPLGEAPNAGWFNYVPLAGLDYNTRAEHRRLCARHGAARHLDDSRLGELRRHAVAHARAGHVDRPLADARVGHADRVGRQPVGGAVGEPRVLPVVARPAASARISSMSPTAAAPLLWQHLFWMFAHPWVYVVVLPAMGIVSDALPVFCRRPLVGYAPVALSTVATMVIGFVVWIHHMFATGIPPLALAFFGAASMLISIPSAVADLRVDRDDLARRPVFRVPFLYFAGFVLLFVIGGVSGVHDRRRAVRLATHRHLFRRRASALRAARHQRVSGASAASTYWFPKFTGTDDERADRASIAFWVMFIGFNSASSRCISRACSACRGASTPIRRRHGLEHGAT